MRPRGLGGLLLAVLVATGCTDEKIVQVARDLTSDVPAAAAGFVGYYQVEAKQTTCGQCHVGQQGEWVGTAHADAWAGLESSGSMQAVCTGCHTVNQTGNSATSSGGYATVQDERYHDVQCESCHGPGLEHVKTPDRTEPPLAAMQASLEGGCGACHQGDHHPFVEEWSASGHGTAVASPAGRSACVQCHAGEDVLKAWGINVEYLEKPTLDDPGQHLGVTCAVCHDPHAKTEDAQLRFPIDALDEEENLCMKCHHKRGKPDPTTYRGAHSPEGPLVVGDAGWWPPNFTAPGGRLAGTHSSDRNPRLCAGCHVRAYSVTGPSGTVNMTGHSFQATPCVDGSGVPVNGECEESQKSYQGCVAGNCHGSEAAARSIKAVAELRLERLADELDLLVKKIPSTEFDETDSRYTSGEGAKFNVALARFHGTAVHNPFLMEALLIASIQQVKTEYGLSAQTGVSLVQEMTGN